MNTTESPSRLNQLHKLWITEPTTYEAEFFTELRLSITKAVAKITYERADQDIVSDTLLHLLSTPRGKAKPRLEQFEPRGSFFSWVWETTKRHLKDVRKKKTPQLVQVEDEREWEEHLYKFAKSNPPAQKVDVGWIKDAATRKIAEAVLDGEDFKDAAEAAGLTANIARMRLRKLRETNSPEVMTEAYERSEEARAIREWRPLFKIAVTIEEDDPRLNAGWEVKKAA